jgi:AraC-like DNA-binding protein
MNSNNINSNKPNIWENIKFSSILYAGRIQPNASWLMPNHKHLWWELIYFLKGSGKVFLPDETLHPQQYHLLIYPPGLPHDERSNPVDPEETIYMGIDVKGNLPAGTHLILPDPNGDLRWLAEHINEEYRNKNFKLAESYMHSYLTLTESLFNSAVSIKHDFIDIAVQHIQCNYMQDITTNSLAKLAFVSETHLTHTFSSRMGTSPMKYLQMIRIENAKRLLSTSDKTISEIASLVGFNDPLYFSRVFRLIIGHSPKIFRNQRIQT